MGDTDIVNAKDKDRIFAPLHTAALVMKRRNHINRHIADRGGDFLPVLARGGKPVQNNRPSRSHMDAVVRPVLVTSSNDVLWQSGMGQIESAVGIGKDPSSLGRRDLKGGVAHPFH